MSFDLIKYAFSTGEISPAVVGRADLEKYDLAVALAYNWFVDYRGGISTRPGTEFVDYILHDDKDIKTFDFQFQPRVRDTYLLVFGDYYIRFVQDGAYVLEDDVAITNITESTSPVVTAPAHGYSDGDWIRLFDIEGLEELNGQLFRVGSPTTNEFRLEGPFGEWVSTLGLGPYVSGGVAKRVYTLDSPYPAEALAGLQAKQRRNLVRLTHLEYPTYDLVRNDHTDWDIDLMEIGNTVPIPAAPTLTPSASGAAGTVVAITAVDFDGQESLPSDMSLEETMLDYAVTRGSMTISWTYQNDIAYYNVYRGNILPDGSNVSKAMQLGYLGSAVGTEFVDNNIIPDFTTAPPQHYNPFVNGTVEWINVTNPGSGYAKTAAISLTDPTGTGFVGAPIVDDAGRLIGVKVINGGEGYTNPSALITGGGTGAAVNVILSPQQGNYPSVSDTFQKRQIFAATLNEPLTLWGSKPEQPNNFDVSAIVAPNDSYEFDVESNEVSPIKHLKALRTGLLIFSTSGVWNLNAGGDAVTPTQALADPQSYQGCSDVPPLQINEDLLYISGRGTTVRLLTYNDVFKVYSGQDMSILANHLFAENKQIIDWSFAQEPYRLVYGARGDGAMLGFTIVKEQNVFAWTQWWTQGYFISSVSLQEGLYDRVYTVTERFINGQWRKFIERFALREFPVIEDAICADAAVTSTSFYPDAAATAQTGVGNNDIIQLGSPFNYTFTAADIGKIIRLGGGKAEITDVLGINTARVKWLRPFTDFIPETEIPLGQPAGSWTLDSEFTEFFGLAHLEGMTVVALADGNVFKDLVVQQGKVTLPVAASRVTVGLGYRCILRTLPPSSQQIVMENKRKKVYGVYMRNLKSRGIKTGGTLDNLYEARERVDEEMGQPIREISGVQGVLIDTDWDINGQTYIVQDNPLPATVLGLVVDADMGDDQS